MQSTILPPSSPDALWGGHLSAIMAGCMLPPACRPRFLELAAKGVPPAGFLEQFERLFGWTPPAEIIEYEGLRLALGAHLLDIPDRWMFIASDDEEEDLAFADEMTAHPELAGDEDLSIEYPPPSARFLLRGSNADETLDLLLSSYPGTMFLFTGLLQLGSDPCGDSCWGSLLPHPRGAVEVFPYDHEVGEVQKDVHYSLAHFVATQWDSGDDEEDDDGDDDDADEDDEEEQEQDESDDDEISDDDEEDDEEDSDDGPQTSERFLDENLVGQFEKEAKKLQKARPPVLQPAFLFHRAHWLLGHTYDDPTYAFAEHIDHAASFSIWQREKKHLREWPHLIFYWMIAHYFLQNDAACREACHLALDLPGELGRALGRRILAQLDTGKPEAFKAVPSPERLQKLRELTLKNAAEKLLEEKARALLALSTTEAGVAKLTKSDCERRLKAEEDPFALIAEYPDDVETHDRCLAKAGEGDAELKKIVASYLKERTDSYYNTWPYDAKNLDRRLSVPCAAAFRSGLRYDSDHKKAFCGITKTLGMFDDDAAMQAFAEAIDRLEQDDDRFESIIESLNQSRHAQAPELLRKAAWRFLGSTQDAVEKQRRIQAKGATLDAIFMENSKLRPALCSALRLEDTVAEQLADAVLAHQQNPAILGLALGDAFRVVRRRGLNQHVDTAGAYLQKVVEVFSGVKKDAEVVEFRVLYNCSEAAITFAACAPDRAPGILKEAFDNAQTLPHVGSRMDLMACLLSGLFLLEPNDPAWREWLDRVLGNRSGEHRVYGPLVAAGEIGKSVKFDPGPEILASIRHHVYADPRPVVDYTPTYIEAAARESWTILTGAGLPAFDASDEYANGQEGDAIAEAINHPERFSLEHVFERVREENLRHSNVVRYGGPWLLDSLRYSGDEARYTENRDRWNCLKAMILQGGDALPALAKCLDLKNIKRSWFPVLFATMRFCENEAEARINYAGLRQDELMDRLLHPTTADLPFIDILASSAFALAGEDALEPAMAALKIRFQYLDDEVPHHSDLDIMLASLPRVIVSSGESGRTAVKALRAEWKANEEAGSILSEALNHSATPIAAIEAPAPGSQLDLVMADPDNDVRRVFRLNEQADAAHLSCEIDMASSSLLPEGKLQSGFECTKALSRERLIRAAQLEGFAPVARKGGKAGKVQRK